MKDSEFLAQVMDTLGPKEHWCQGAWHRPRPHLYARGRRPTTSEILNNPSLASSVCLDTAIQITARQALGQFLPDSEFLCVKVGKGFQVDRVREALKDTMREQYPDLFANTLAHWEAEWDSGVQARVARAYVEHFLDNGSQPSRDYEVRSAIYSNLSTPGHDSIPFYNDHESMTYEGVVSTLEKTIVSLQEQGR